MIGDVFVWDVMVWVMWDGDDGEVVVVVVFVLVSARGGADDASGVRWYERGSDGLREEMFMVEMFEVECIVVDEVVKIVLEGWDLWSVWFVLSLELAATATTALRDRLVVVFEYFCVVKDGRVVFDCDVLCEVVKVMVVL